MPLRILFLLATIAVLASCFPEDEIIPEMSHAEVLTLLEQPTNSDMATKSTDFNHRAKALDTITLIKAKGGGTKECVAVAEELHASVDAYVAASNQELHALSTGSECPEKGQSDVTKCAIKQGDAQNDATAAGHAVKAALRAPQQLALEDLMNCMSSGLCPQIETARATLESAKKTEVEKDAAVIAIKDECSDFETSAARQMAECQCAAKKAHDKAWEAVTSGAAEREKSYKTANELLCALNKDATCKDPPTPTVDAVVLAKGVAGAVCPAGNDNDNDIRLATANEQACDKSDPAFKEFVLALKAANPLTYMSTRQYTPTMRVEDPGSCILDLRHAGIAVLPAGIFDKLTALTLLNLDSNLIISLPAGIFDKLTALTTLQLSRQCRPEATCYGKHNYLLPARSFDKLTALTKLDLGASKIAVLPAGIFDKLTALTQLVLSKNQIAELPAGIFDKLTVLTTLKIHDNKIVSLSSGIFDKLTALTELNFGGNQIVSLHAGMFDKLTALTIMSFYRTQIVALPAGIFDKLTALKRLSFYYNQIVALPAGIFDKLTALTLLDLDRIVALPAGISSGIRVIRK